MPRRCKPDRGFVTAIAATLLSGCAWSIAPPAFAADLILKAEPASLVVPWWVHYYVEVGARAFLNNPRARRRHRSGRPEPRQVLRVQHHRAGTVSVRLGLRRQHRRRLPGRCLGEKRRLQRSAVWSRLLEGRPALFGLRVGPDAARLQHQRAHALQRRGIDESDAAARTVEPDVHGRRLSSGSCRLRQSASRPPTPPWSSGIS